MKYLVSVLVIVACLFAGCSGRLIAEGEIYYPKENGGNVCKSRAEFHRSSSWNRKTAGSFYQGGR